MKIKIISFSLFTLVIMFFLPTAILAKSAQVTFLPLGTSIETTTFDNIPFQIWGASLAVQKPPEGQGEDVYESEYLMPSWSEYHANKVHIIQTSIWAAELTDGTVVGQIRTCYRDNTCDDPVDLEIGINTAEWSYDRPELQDILAHTKIPPAYSNWTNIDSDYWYWGHAFYIGIDTDPAKTLDHIELVLDEDTRDSTESVGVTISAITIEIPEAPPEIKGGGYVTCEDGVGKCAFAFDVKRKEGKAWPTGYLFFNDPGAEVMLVATDFRRFTNSSSIPGATFVNGWGQVNGEDKRFSLWIIDDGNPGPENDQFQIRIQDLYAIDLDFITAGNIIVKSND